MNRSLHIFSLVSLIVACATTAAASPVISEFMAANRETLADHDGDFSDWIEIHNPDTTPLDLTGWYLTDNANRKTKWQFPAVTIPEDGRLVVFASGKDRAQPDAPLHTNFSLSSDGEYLGLIAPDGTAVVSEFAPAYPSQLADTAYGIASTNLVGLLETPTPGTLNSAAAPTTISLLAEDGTSSSFSSALPIVILDNAGFGPQLQSDGGIEGSLQLVAARSEFTSSAGLSVRGSSSADFPKKSYSIELHQSDGKQRPSSLLGLARESDWALVSPWSYDPSYLRNAYLYASSNRIGRWAPRTRFTEVFFKRDAAGLNAGHYHGIGVLTERIKIDDQLVDIQSLDSTDIAGEAVTGGYILKIDPRDHDEFGWKTERGIPESTYGEIQLVVVSPKAAKLAPEQRDYIQGYVQAFENALFADRDAQWSARSYLDYIDRPSWVDYHLLQVLAKNPDGLIRSAYFTKDRGGKLKAGPAWDFDRAMGSADPRSQASNEWNSTTEDGAAQFWSTGWWGVLANDPDFMQAWVDRWQSLRRDALSTERLAALAHSLGAQIDPSAAARDAARWPDNASRFGSHRGEVDHLVSWLTQRANWIDRQFIAPPVPVQTATGVSIAPPRGLILVYTLDGSDPRASGGAVATSAIAVAGQYDIPDGTTLTARIYDPAAATSAIGSAWSSTITVTGSIPAALLPGIAPAQIATLSSRAVLTGGAARFVTELVVPDGEPKQFVLRAVGLTLTQLGVANALLDPVLELISSDGAMVATNSDWRTGDGNAALATRFAAVGAFPLVETQAEGRDAAVAVTLKPGRYSVVVRSESGRTGVVLVDAYAGDAGSAVKTISARSPLTAGEGFHLALGIVGNETRRFLIRAVGAGGDTALQLFSGTQSLASNDDWSYSAQAGEIATAAYEVSAIPLEPGGRDAAIVTRLRPGIYALHVSTHSAAPSGVRLEVYELP